MKNETLAEQQIPYFIRKLNAIPETKLPKTTKGMMLSLVANFTTIYEYCYRNPDIVLDIYRILELKQDFDTGLDVTWDKKTKKLMVSTNAEMAEVFRKVKLAEYNDNTFEMGFMSTDLEFNGSDSFFGIKVKSEGNTIAIGFALGMNQGKIKNQNGIEEIDINKMVQKT